MNDLRIFENKEFGEVRTSIINDEPYFNLNDVCRILEINNPSQAKTRLNSKGVITSDILTNGGRQQANFINESNLYKLIFQSRKLFKRVWLDDWMEMWMKRKKKTKVNILQFICVSLSCLAIMTIFYYGFMYFVMKLSGLM